jgi:CHAT domain-containing protein
MRKNQILIKLPSEIHNSMSLFRRYIYLIIIVFIPFFCNSQNSNFIADSLRSVDLYKEAFLLYKKGLYTKSLDNFNESLNLRKKIYGPKNKNLAGVYVGIGRTYRNLGQSDLALQNYQMAETNYLLAKTYPYSQMANLFIDLGNVYRTKLDYIKALQYFEQAISIFKNEISASPQDIAGINYSIADIYYITNQNEKAIKLANQNVKTAYPEDQILFYDLLASICQVEGNITKAKENFKKAIELTIELNKDNYLTIAASYLKYSGFLVSIDQFSEADKALNKSFQYIQLSKVTNGEVIADYYKTAGLITDNKPVSSQNLEIFKQQKRQNLYEAVNFYRKGLTALNFPKNYDIDFVNENREWISLFSCIELLKLIADNYSELSNLDQSKDVTTLNEPMLMAIKTYGLLGSLIQQARKEISDDESKIQLTAIENSTFHQIINISYTAYSITHENKYLELAFENSERIKSSSIFDKISDQLALEKSLVPDSLLNLERKLISSVTIFFEKLFEENSKSNPDSTLINQYNKEIFSAKKSREELARFIENNYKDFYDLKYSNSMLSAKEIQKKINRDKVIIEYVFNDSDTVPEVYSFIISSEKLDFKKLNVNPGFSETIENMFDFISDVNYMFTKKEDARKFCINSNELYNTLILPLTNEIENKNITIIPDGKLCYIPFDALLEELPDTSKNIEFNQLNYLIRSYCINYSNSANLLYKQVSGEKKSRIKVLAFAPEYKEGEYIEIARKKYELIQLPGIQKEVEKISTIMKTKAFFGEDASEENFRNNVENYDILHLAMHAFINDSLPAFSSLAFAQTKSNNSLNNGMLNTADIYNFKLKAKLTVLSACNTGTGQLKQGEGIMSLARGFLYAGCPTIIMSLWEVDDESGTEIMTSFYKNLKKGKSKDESLRQSKLSYLESVNSRKAHPHYWLGFVSIGDNSSMYNSYDYYFFIILILAIIGIGIDQGIRIKKARNKRA